MQTERRNTVRFSANVPLTIFIGERAIPAYTRDVSDRGVYFYLGTSDSELIDRDFEFTLNLPPEVTLSTWCSIQCRARVARKEFTPSELTGIAAEIIDYSLIGYSVQN
jgi:hypothetical protein